MRKNKSFLFITALLASALIGLSSCAGIYDLYDKAPSPHGSGKTGTVNEELYAEPVHLKDDSSDPDVLTDSLSAVIIDTLGNYKPCFSADRRISTSELNAALRKTADAAPDLFWTNGYAISSGSGSDECQVYFKMIDDFTPEELKKMHDELEEAAGKIIAQIPEDSDDYEKILFVHDYIVNSTEYDFEGAGKGEAGLYSTAYGCLVNGKAVCEGYAEAFQYIMNKIGIESGICTGIADSQPHGWNYVKLNGNYYWIDVTWDDPQSEPDAEDEETEKTDVPGIRHTYFLINDELLFRSREADPEYKDTVPECTSLEENYYMKKEAFFTEYSFENIAGLISQDDGTRKLEMMFTGKEAYDEAVNRLFKQDEILGLADYTELSEMINWSYDERMYELFIYY
ncbi:MAG: hypothetical protein IKN85_04700 [Oscillospiraceae bacterium]|nr:hypothetical protein [Oscillospiraceae bacterium]MBR3535110.1 hypothetical protein [Oscillospiraceae bacterium]